jgi:hypothetical protein
MQKGGGAQMAKRYIHIGPIQTKGQMVMTTIAQLGSTPSRSFVASRLLHCVRPFASTAGRRCIQCNTSLEAALSGRNNLLKICAKARMPIAALCGRGDRRHSRELWLAAASQPQDATVTCGIGGTVE